MNTIKKLCIVLLICCMSIKSMWAFAVDESASQSNTIPITSYSTMATYNTFGWVLGDVDGDDDRDNVDEVKLARYLVGSETFNTGNKVRSDINCDGELSSIDLIMLARANVEYFHIVTGDFSNIDRSAATNYIDHSIVWKTNNTSFSDTMLLYWENAINDWEELSSSRSTRNDEDSDYIFYNTSSSSSADVILSQSTNVNYSMGVSALNDGNVQFNSFSFMEELSTSQRYHSTLCASGLCLGLGIDTSNDVMYDESRTSVTAFSESDEISFDAAMLYFNHFKSAFLN